MILALVLASCSGEDPSAFPFQGIGDVDGKADGFDTGRALSRARFRGLGAADLFGALRPETVVTEGDPTTPAVTVKEFGGGVIRCEHRAAGTGSAAESETTCAVQGELLLAEEEDKLMVTDGAALFTQMTDDTIVFDVPGNASTAAMTAKRSGGVMCVRTGATTTPPTSGATTCRIEAIALVASTGPEGECEAAADCGSGEICTGPEGCAVEWTCQPAPSCSRERVEFCSCAGETFEASGDCPGRPVAHAGPCAVP
jgi:hypothetical protein